MTEKLKITDLTQKEKAFLYCSIKGTYDTDIHKELGIYKKQNMLTSKQEKEQYNLITDLDKDRQKELSQYGIREIREAITESEPQKDRNNKQQEYNPFLECIKEHNIIFDDGLLNNGKKPNLSYKQTCKELFIESVKLYATPYKQEYYIKKNSQFNYIGVDYEAFLEKMYMQIPFSYRELIPFSSIIGSITKLRIFEKLEPNRDYILFRDCLLNINTGEATTNRTITENTVPYCIIDYNYLDIDKEVQEYIFSLFERIDTANIIKSLLYGMFNKRVLNKTKAIFNIQASNRGKTLLVTSFTEAGLFRNVNYEMLNGNNKIELFKQYYTVVFEEIQEKVINGSTFNALIDNTSMAVPRKYKEAVTVPKELKPVIYINGESMPNFKGRTKGTFNRFVFIPDFKEALTEDDYYNITANPVAFAVEMLRNILDYVKTVGQDTIKENIEKGKKKETEVIDMKENKVKIVFKYIKEQPDFSFDKTVCLSKAMLVELIKELQTRDIITVDLFNSDTSIRHFINKILMPCMDTDITEDETTDKNIYVNNKRKTARLRYILQLTEQGENIMQDLGYSIKSLQI